MSELSLIYHTFQKMFKKVSFFFLLLALTKAANWKLVCSKIIKENPTPEYTFFNVLDIAVDEEGALYVLDNKACTIRKFSREGKFITSFGRRGQGPGEFLNPNKLYLQKDSLYVLDSKNLRITLLDKNLNLKKEISILKYVTDFFVADGKVYASIVPLMQKFNFVVMEPSGLKLKPVFYFFEEEPSYLKNNLLLKRNRRLYFALKAAYGSVVFAYDKNLSKIAASFRACGKDYGIFLLELDGKVIRKVRVNLDPACKDPSFRPFLKGIGKGEEMILIFSLHFLGDNRLVINYRHSNPEKKLRQDYLAIVNLKKAAVEGRIKLKHPVQMFEIKGGELFLKKVEEDTEWLYKCRLIQK